MTGQRTLILDTTSAAVRAALDADVLNYAAGLIDTVGWLTGDLYDRDQAAAEAPRERCRMDLLGAIACAVHGDPAAAEGDQVDTWNPVKTLAAFLGLAGDPNPSYAISAFNDADITDATAAARILRAAAGSDTWTPVTPTTNGKDHS